MDADELLARQLQVCAQSLLNHVPKTFPIAIVFLHDSST